MRRHWGRIDFDCQCCFCVKLRSTYHCGPRHLQVHGRRCSHDDGQRLSFHGRDHQDFEIDLDRVSRSLGHVDRLCGANSHHGDDAEVLPNDVLESVRVLEADGHGQNQSAKMQRVEYVPTRLVFSGGKILDRRACCTSIFNRSSRPIRLLCISWYASSASRRLSYSTNANLENGVVSKGRKCCRYV